MAVVLNYILPPLEYALSKNVQFEFDSLVGLINTEISGLSSTYAPIAATYVTLSTNSSLTNERVLTAGTAISIADGGAGSTITVNNTGVTSITGTANQVIASASTGPVTLSLPQSINTTSTPTFSKQFLTDTTNQIVLGTTRTVTITAPTPASSSRTITFPDLSADYSVVGTAGSQTIGGAKTFTSDLTVSGTTDKTILIDVGANSASSILKLSCTSAANDVFIHFNVVSGTSYVFGVDNSDSDRLKISKSSALGTTDLFYFDPSNNGAVFTASAAITASLSGATIALNTENTSNTASSHAQHTLTVAGTSAGDSITTWQISGSTAWSAGLDNSDSDNWVLSRSSSLGTNNAIVSSGSTGAVSIRGTNTNDSAAAGFVGEYVSSLITSATNFPTSTQYGDLTSISLTAGDWDVSMGMIALDNGGSVNQIEGGISTTSGNSSSGMNDGDNLMYQLGPQPNYRTSVSIASYRMSLSATTTVYLKFASNYTVAAPRARGRISARRVR